MNVGTIVTYNHSNKSESFVYGRVVGVESYTDSHGTRTWFHVRWFDCNGRPDPNAQQHSADELIVADP